MTERRCQATGKRTGRDALWEIEDASHGMTATMWRHKLPKPGRKFDA